MSFSLSLYKTHVILKQQRENQREEGCDDDEDKDDAAFPSGVNDNISGGTPLLLIITLQSMQSQQETSKWGYLSNAAASKQRRVVNKASAHKNKLSGVAEANGDEGKYLSAERFVRCVQ